MTASINAKPQSTQEYYIGDLVEVGRQGGTLTRAVVYDVFEIKETTPIQWGISIISHSGLNLGDWLAEELTYVKFIRKNTLLYQYQSLDQLAIDFDNGVFAHCFQTY